MALNESILCKENRVSKSDMENHSVKGTAVSGWSLTIGCLPRLGLWHGGAIEDFYFLCYFSWRIVEELFWRSLHWKKCYFSEEVFHCTRLTFIDQRQKFTISCRTSGILREVGEVIFYFVCVTTIVSNLPQSHKVSPIWGFKPNCHPCLDMALQ